MGGLGRIYIPFPDDTLGALSVPAGTANSRGPKPAARGAIPWTGPARKDCVNGRRAVVKRNSRPTGWA